MGPLIVARPPPSVRELDLELELELEWLKGAPVGTRSGAKVSHNWLPAIE